MRFLCLHGLGTSARIFEAQISHIVALLGGQHEFVYVDGEVETQALAGVDKFFTGPFYCFYGVPTPDALQDAFDAIWDVIDEEGPFDGVIGFSQGGALASSFIMADARSLEPRHPFKCAIFFCASMPFDTTSRPLTVNLKNGTCHHADTGEVIQDFSINQYVPEATDSGWSGEADESTHILHRYTSPLANPEKAMMMIPTTHIVGLDDDYYEQSCALRDLCTPLNRHFFEHKLGHEIPKDRNSTTKIVQCIHDMFTDVLIG